MNSDNPILKQLFNERPDFSAYAVEAMLEALNRQIQDNQEDLAGILAEQPKLEHLLQLAAIDERLDRLSGPIKHLHSVCDSEALRPVYQQAIQWLTAYHSELAQNKKLYALIKELHDLGTANSEQQAALKHALRDFRLSGAELSDDAQQLFTKKQMRAAELAALFEQHVLDDTHAFQLHVEHREELDGLPESIRAAAKQAAEQAQQTGWLFTLDAPSYMPFMQHANKRSLREQMYRAYSARASHADTDNHPIMQELLAIRHDLAQMLGFQNYAALSLASKMASSSSEVEQFLRNLAEKSRPHAEADLAELQDFASQKLGLEKLEAWDIAWASERLRQHRYALSDEELKPYFSEKAVLQGLFETAEALYGIQFRPCQVDTWHESVHYYHVLDDKQQIIAGFYLDPYARPHKRGGAWMDECRIRWRKADGSLQQPIAYLVCNFAAPIGDQEALWTHQEVLTLFHEFGHGLHHMLSTIETLDVSGIRGVPWDAVELPSQFMENFCWCKEALCRFAKHHQTGETLPDALFDKLLAARNFQSGLHTLRQIEFSLFDLLIHAQDHALNSTEIRQTLDSIRDDIAVLKAPEFNHFECSFSHIFAGGYAAGYYSYKWAELLSADVFAAFEEEGLFNRQTAQRFRDCVLSIGGSKDIAQAFLDFRGRPPSIDALLRHSGLSQEV